MLLDLSIYTPWKSNNRLAICWPVVYFKAVGHRYTLHIYNQGLDYLRQNILKDLRFTYTLSIEKRRNKYALSFL
jgi:hypothetical protein